MYSIGCKELSPRSELVESDRMHGFVRYTDCNVRICLSELRMNRSELSDLLSRSGAKSPTKRKRDDESLNKNSEIQTIDVDLITSLLL